MYFNPNFAEPNSIQWQWLPLLLLLLLLVPRIFFHSFLPKFNSSFILGPMKNVRKIWIKWSVNAIERQFFFPFDECLWFGQVNDDDGDDQRTNEWKKNNRIYILLYNISPFAHRAWSENDFRLAMTRTTNFGLFANGAHHRILIF